MKNYIFFEVKDGSSVTISVFYRVYNVETNVLTINYPED